MSTRLKTQKLLIVGTILALVLILAPTVGAFSFPDLISPLKGLLAKPTPPKVLQVGSKITLAEGGDLNKNGQIDTGDTVTFTYTIKNTTDKNYPYSTLKTNIPRGNLNFIHNVQGVTGLTDSNGTITAPNLRVQPQSETVIKFDARVNFSDQTDVSVHTEPELVDQNGNSVIKSARSEVTAKKINKEELMKYVNTIRKKAKP